MNGKRCPVCNCEPHRLLAVCEVAAALCVSAQTVRNWIASGLLAATQIKPRGSFQVHHNSLDGLMTASRTIEAVPKNAERPSAKSP